MLALDHSQVLALVESGAADIVETLPDHEYRTVHIRGAIHLPLPRLWGQAPSLLQRDRWVVVYCRDSLCDLSARAAAQLEYHGFNHVDLYPRGKADWIVRGLPSEPSAPIAERLRALPYFVHNLFPDIRRRWIELSRRSGVGDAMASDLPRLSPRDRVFSLTLLHEAPPYAVVLNGAGILLGTIDAIEDINSDVAAEEVMNPAPQTIRPDMTHKLAAHLLRHSPYLLITTAAGRYLGRYAIGS
jgi:rhodanese-related sulfurtransferase